MILGCMHMVSDIAKIKSGENYQEMLYYIQFHNNLLIITEKPSIIFLQTYRAIYEHFYTRHYGLSMTSQGKIL
jgi:hypothetical protein